MDTGTEIRDAVKIVIEQMRDHPEEFDTPEKFAWACGEDTPMLHGFNDAETKAYRDALANMRYRKFHDAVLTTLLETKPQLHAVERFAQAMVRQGSSLKPKKLYVSPTQIAIAKKILGKTA